MLNFKYKNLVILLNNKATLQTNLGKIDLLRNSNLVEIWAEIIFEIPILGYGETLTQIHQIKTDFANIIQNLELELTDAKNLAVFKHQIPDP